MRENPKLRISEFSFLFLPGNVKLHLNDRHLALFQNPINFSMLPELCEGRSRTLLADWKPLSAALCLDKFPLWVLWVAARVLIFWLETAAQRWQKFSSVLFRRWPFTAQICLFRPHRSYQALNPLTAATVERLLGIKCHSGGFQRKSFFFLK